MKKTEKYIYIVIIVILVGVIVAGATYMFMKDNNNQEVKEDSNNQNDNKENKNNEPIAKEDGVKLNKVYNLNDKIIEEFEVTLNGKKNTMNVTFEYTKATDAFDEEISNTISIQGKFQSNELVKAFADLSESSFNIDKVKQLFNEKNFKIIKGTNNKNYLLLIPNIMLDGFDIELYIFNDNLEQIKNTFDSHLAGCDKKDKMTILTTEGQQLLENNINPWYPNSFNIELNGNINVKIEDNKIYYLTPVYNLFNGSFTGKDYGVLEERIYTINNDKLEHTVNNTYKIIDIAGSVCVLDSYR